MDFAPTICSLAGLKPPAWMQGQAILAKLRQAQQNLARRTRDLGFIPEGERLTRAQGTAPYDFGHDDARYPFARVFAAAELASLLCEV